MKKLAMLIVSFSFLITVFAQQQRLNTVVININGNNNLLLTLDGKTYTVPAQNNMGHQTNITLNNLENGLHTIAISRMGYDRRRNDNIATQFNLRRRYNMVINVNSDGSLELNEKRKNYVANNRSAIGEEEFNRFYRNLRRGDDNYRYNLINNAFNTNNTYFTTSQIMRLMQTINGEPTRLQLAKQGYNRVADPDNYSQTYSLVNSPESKYELEDYIGNYDDGDDNKNDNGKWNDNDRNNNNGNNNNGNDRGKNGGIRNRTAISDADFNNLYQSIRNQWPAAAQVNSISNAFNNNTNYFTANQASQLIQMVRDENTKLQLAKAAYNNVIDKNNFNVVANLLNSQSSREELRNFIMAN